MNLSVRLNGFTIYSNQKPEGQNQHFVKVIYCPFCHSIWTKILDSRSEYLFALIYYVL